MSKEVRISEALREGFGLTMANFVTLFVMAIVYMAAFAAAYTGAYFLNHSVGNGAIIQTITWGAKQLFDGWLRVGVILMLLHMCRGNHNDLATMFKGFPYLLWYLVGTLLVSLLYILAFVPGLIAMVLCWLVMGISFAELQALPGAGLLNAWFTLVSEYGGFLILELVILGIAIIPPFYVSAVYFFVPYLIVDKGMKPLEALQASAQITQGGRMGLINFMVVSSLLSILGFLALVIGLAIAIPVVFFATVSLYATLLRQTEHQLGHAIGGPGILNAEIES
ncbi:MAG: hypothetical protein GC168_12655 [Candidatus Hydrogenedens sp.]|nr:hypothetical protein [Candidatus Hydrogenedens sp.]